MKVSWLLRGSRWRSFHLDDCLECRRTFERGELGSWTDNRSGAFPELCNCRDRKGRRTTTHTNCRAWGPYCPECAPKVEARLFEIREAYRD